MKKQYFFALITVLIWGSSATILKSMFSNLPNMEVLCVSSIFSFLFLLLSNLAKKNLHNLKNYTPGQVGKLFALGFAGLFAYNALYYRGIDLLTAQEACILNYLWPVMLVLFSCLILGERLSLIKAFAIFCSFLGVVVLSLGADATTGPARWIGSVCCLLAAACYGLYCVYNKKLNLDQSITMMISWATVAIGAGILGLLTENWVMIQGTQWFGILWMGIVVNAFAYLAWAVALNHSLDSSRIANLAYLTPFCSIILSAIFLQEAITWNKIAALVIIISGVLISQLNKESN